MRDFEKDVKIDDQQLDVEWLQQAELGIKYGKLWADAKYSLQQAQREREHIRSTLIQQVNSDPEKYLGKGAKATGVNIEAFYRQHEMFMEATQVVDDAVYQLDLAETAKREISVTRKNALSALTELMSLSYFAGPKEPRNLQAIMEEKRKECTGKVGRRFSRKNKTE